MTTGLPYVLIGIAIGILINHFLKNDHQFKLINLKLDHMAKTQAEAVAQLNSVATQLEKVRQEVQKLKEAAEAEDDLSPELEAAINNVASAVQGVDDINADAPAPEPTPEG